MKRFELKGIVLGVLAVLAVGLIFLPTERRNHSKQLAGVEQKKINLTIHHKLKGMARGGEPSDGNRRSQNLQNGK